MIHHPGFFHLLLQVLFYHSDKNISNHTLFSMALPPKVYQFLVSIFASLGSFLFGYDLGVIAEAIASESFIQKFGNNPNEL